MHMGRHARKEKGLRGAVYMHSDSIIVVLMVLIMMIVTVIGMKAWYTMHPVVKTVTVTVKAKPTPRADEDKTIRELVRSLKKDRPDLDDVHVASIAGNVWGESNGDWNSIELGRSNTTPDLNDNSSVRKWAESNGTGIGVLQWTDSRMKELVDMADSSHEKWSDPDVQTRFLIHELDDQSKWTGGNDGWVKANDVKTATNTMLDDFVRPSDPDQSRIKRINGALDVYKALQNGTIKS